MKKLILLNSGFRSLTRHKLRSSLSILGVVFGVVALISMLSIGEGAKREALRQIELLGTNNVIAKSLGQTEAQEIKARENLSRGLTLDDADRLKIMVPGIFLVAALKEIEAEIIGGPVETAYQLAATTENYNQVKNLGISQGRYISARDQKMKNLVCVLGWDIARDLGQQGRLGSKLRIEDTVFKVVGILEKRHWSKSKLPALTSRNYNRCVFIPLNSSGVFDRNWRSAIPVSEISVQFRDSGEVIQGAAVIESALTRFHHQVKDYQLIIPQELIREAQQTQKIFNIVLGGIAGISLLVGGIGIMNIMLATVSERTREIGIRRAVGANQRDIAVQFLTEAIILTVTEGIIGSILGCAISIFISVLAGWETVVTGWAVVAALGMAIIVGVIFGFYPAYNAAKLDPIQALRNE